MANELYRDHLIISRANYDGQKAGWTATVTISWKHNGCYHFHRLSKLWPTGAEEDAVEQGFMLGRLWVDNTL